MAREPLARVAAAIGDETRSRMLLCLMDGRARTSTELAAACEVSAPTASEHLGRLRQENLVRVHAQGRHRYYALESADVAALLEQLGVVAGRYNAAPSTTPPRLRAARTCYDHLAGSLGVALHDRLLARGWLAQTGEEYTPTPDGLGQFAGLGVDVRAAQAVRRRFAYACVDWSERTPHIAGALGAALLQAMSRNGWLAQDLDSRAVSVTRSGRRAFESRLGIRTA